VCAVLNGSKKFTRRHDVYRLRDHRDDAAIKNSGGVYTHHDIIGPTLFPFSGYIYICIYYSH